MAALALAAVLLAPASAQAADHSSTGEPVDDYSAEDTADYTAGYDTANYGDRARVQWRQEPTTSRKIFDAAFLRPLQFVQLVVSAVIFVPAYPAALAFGAGDEVLEICITEPTDRLFRKPLGAL